MHPEPHIRALTPDDAAAYTALRREMLTDAPWAFGSSPEDDLSLNAQTLAARLTNPGSTIIAAFAHDQPERMIGAAGLIRNSKLKITHRAEIWGMYVAPAHRGRGIAKAIITRALEIARSWPGVNSVGLSASTHAPAAIGLYQQLGFQQWGVEPAALMLNGRAFDEVHMVLFFEVPPPAPPDTPPPNRR